MITGIKLGGLPKETLESIASFNRIIRNYMMMKKLKEKHDASLGKNAV